MILYHISPDETVLFRLFLSINNNNSNNMCAEFIGFILNYLLCWTYVCLLIYCCSLWTKASKILYTKYICISINRRNIFYHHLKCRSLLSEITSEWLSRFEIKTVLVIHTVSMLDIHRACQITVCSMFAFFANKFSFI